METFDYLPLREKVWLLKHEANFVTSINLPEETVTLYRLNNLLVEHHTESSSKRLTRIASLNSFEVLKFLPHLDVTVAYKLLVG